MSSFKRPGKRERQARKRHRRGQVFCVNIMPAGAPLLKAGREHTRRMMNKSFAVAESEEAGLSVPWRVPVGLRPV